MAARRLKVFQAQFGFYDSVVAAASQAAALRAWGAHQNLFANGQAREATDEDAVAAALARPDIPLRRALGSSDPFELEPAGLPRVPDAPGPAAAKTSFKASAGLEAEPPPQPKLQPPPADRTALADAEAELRALDERRKTEEAEFRERQEALDARRREAQDRYVEGRRAASAAVVTAREAYRKAGGRD